MLGVRSAVFGVEGSWFIFWGLGGGVGVLKVSDL